MGGETCASQAHQTGSPGGVGQFFLGGDGRGRSNGGIPLHFPVGLDDHSLGHLTAGEHHFGDLRHGAGDRGVYGSANIGAVVAHHSAHIDVIPLFHCGDAGSADVLLHG